MGGRRRAVSGRKARRPNLNLHVARDTLIGWEEDSDTAVEEDDVAIDEEDENEEEEEDDVEVMLDDGGRTDERTGTLSCTGRELLMHIGIDDVFLTCKYLCIVVRNICVHVMADNFLLSQHEM